MALTREQIEAINDLETQTFHVDKWKGDVLVKKLSPMEHLELSMWAQSLEIDAYFYAKLVARVLVDENRNPLYDYQNNEDLKPLTNKNPESLVAIWNKCWGKEAEEDAKKN